MSKVVQQSARVETMEQGEETHRCSKCKEGKPRGEFYAHPKTTSGLQSHCKECKRASRRISTLRECKECWQMRPREEFRVAVTGGRRIKYCGACVPKIEAREARRNEERKAKRDAERAKKRLDFERPRCVDCGDRNPRSDYEARDGNRVAKVCEGCREARRLTDEVARLAGSPRHYGSGRDPRPHSLAELRRREDVAKRKNARSFAALRANRAEVVGQ